MTTHQSDLILFLRLAGTKSGVHSDHIPSEVIASAAELGGRVRFLGFRVFVGNPAATIRRIRSLAGDSSFKP